MVTFFVAQNRVEWNQKTKPNQIPDSKDSLSQVDRRLSFRRPKADDGARWQRGEYDNEQEQIAEANKAKPIRETDDVVLIDQTAEL